MAKKIRSIGALVILGMLVLVTLSDTVAATPWDHQGNTNNEEGYLGDTDAYNLIFITDDTERMRITSDGDFIFNNLGNDNDFRIKGGTDEKLFFTEGGTNSVGIGTTSPNQKLEVLATSTQLRLAYDTSNYAEFSVDSNGLLTIQNTGTIGDIEIKTTSFGNAIYIDDSLGNVGIGTTSPGSRLEIISGGPTGATSALHVKNSASTSLLFVRDDGNIGIGVTNPAEKLEISGNILFNFGSARTIYIERCPTPQADGNDLTIRAGHANGGQGVSGYDGGDLKLEGGDGEGPMFADGGDVIISGGAQGFSGNVGDIILAHTGAVARGKVGIGTASPTVELDVSGDVQISDSLVVWESAIFNEHGGTYDFRIEGVGEPNLFFVDAYPTPRIGIGTSSPGATLDVRGSAIFNEDGGDNDFRIVGGTDTNLFFVDASKDAIGIGQSSLEHKFHISDSDTNSLRAGLCVEQTGAMTTGTGYGIKVYKTGASTTNVAGYFSATGASNNYGLVVEGDVGIGISSPTHRLTVSSDDDDTLRLIGPDGGGGVGFGARINFGEGDHVYIEEDEDNKLYLYGDLRTSIMGGNVGIGTTNPNTPLYILKNEDNAHLDLITFDRTTSSPANGDSYDILFNHENNNNEQVGFAQITLITSDVGEGYEGGALAFSVANGVDGSMDEAMRITEDGFVGIGDTSPDRVLHIKDTSAPPLKYEYTTGSSKTALDTYIPIDVNGSIYYIKLYN